MRKALLVVAMVLVVGSAAWAQEAAAPAEGPQYNIFTKLCRGIGTALRAPIEIPVTIFNVAADTDVFIGVGAGGVAGVAACAECLGAGALDVATFLFPPYDRPLINYELGKSAAARAATSTFPGPDEF